MRLWSKKVDFFFSRTRNSATDTISFTSICLFTFVYSIKFFNCSNCKNIVEMKLCCADIFAFFQDTKMKIFISRKPFYLT